MQKRGISEVITTLVFILLAIVAIGIIWVVVSGILESNSEEVNLGKFTEEVEVSQVQVNEGNVDVLVRKERGSETDKLKFVFYNESSTKTFVRDVELGAFERKLFSFDYSEISDLGEIKKILVYPLIGEKEGLADEYEFNVLDELKSSGDLLGYWDFENGLNDSSVYGNDGVSHGGAEIIENNGDNVLILGGDGDYVSIADDAVFDIEAHDFTLISCIYTDDDSTWSVPLNKYLGNSPWTGYGIWLYKGKLRGELVDDDTPFSPVNTRYIRDSLRGVNVSSWDMLGVNSNGEDIVLYINGDEVESEVFDNRMRYDNIDNVNVDVGICIGQRCVGEEGSYYFTGMIDDVMIINRSLTDDEMKKLGGLLC